MLQEKVVTVINFQRRNSHTSPLLKQNFILKFQNKISLENILFFSKSLNNLTPSVFSIWFSVSPNAAQINLAKLFYKTNRHEKYSITVSATDSWNKFQKHLKDMLPKDLPSRKTKTIVSIFYFKSY